MKLIINAFVFLALAAIIPGLEISSIWAALFGAIVYSFLSFFVGSLLKFIAFPLNFLTLGLVNVLIGGLVLYMTSGLVGGFAISSFGVAVFASLILGLIQSILYRKEPGNDY